MNREQIKLEGQEFDKNQRKSSNRIAILCAMGGIMAGLLRASGQSETVWLSTLIIAGICVIFERFKQIENRLYYLQIRYLETLSYQINFMYYNRDLDIVSAAYNERLKPDDE